MDICTTSQFLCSLKYPQSRLRTLHNLICDPETFLCDKHIALMEGSIDYNKMLFYAPITSTGAAMIREAMACAIRTSYCDINIVENEIVYSGLSSGSCLLAMESMPKGARLNEALYTYSMSRLQRGFDEFKRRLRKLDISHNNLSTSNIIIDEESHWHTICNYNLSNGFGGDRRSFMAIERKINDIAMPDETPTKVLEQQHLHNITTDADGFTIYPIVESCRRFTSRNGVGFKDRDGNVIIADEYLSATDFMCNRSVVQLKNHKMGIINRKGRYILEPKYSSIDYNPMDGISIVHDGELETRFNYLGEQIEEWH